MAQKLEFMIPFLSSLIFCQKTDLKYYQSTNEFFQSFRYSHRKQNQLFMSIELLQVQIKRFCEEFQAIWFC